MKTEIFRYNENPITFQIEGNGGVMVSASQMAKPFGKLPADWLRTKQSKEFLNAKATMGNHIVTDLVVVINGSDGRGTFMHEDVMVSATAMAKPFDKCPAKWLSSTKEFLTALSTIRKSDSERFVLTINSGAIGKIKTSLKISLLKCITTISMKSIKVCEFPYSLLKSRELELCGN